MSQDPVIAKMEERSFARSIGVTPKIVYAPTIVVQSILQRYAIQCGSCARDFVRWGWFGRIRCWFCQALNRVVWGLGL